MNSHVTVSLPDYIQCLPVQMMAQNNSCGVVTDLRIVHLCCPDEVRRLSGRLSARAEGDVSNVSKEDIQYFTCRRWYAPCWRRECDLEEFNITVHETDEFTNCVVHGSHCQWQLELCSQSTPYLYFNYLPGLCLAPPKLQAHTFFEYSHGIHDTIFGAVYLTGAADIHKANVTVTY